MYVITVSHFGEHKRLHLKSSKQNYYIISLRAIIKAIFTSHRVYSNANNATHYVKLGKKRRESSKRNYYLISPRVIIKANIITGVPGGEGGNAQVVCG